MRALVLMCLVSVACRPASGGPEGLPVPQGGGERPALAAAPASCQISLPPPPGAPALAGPAYVLVDGVGVLRIADGSVTTAVAMGGTLAQSTVMATGPQGELWLSDWGNVRVLGPDGAMRPIRLGSPLLGRQRDHLRPLGRWYMVRTLHRLPVPGWITTVRTDWFLWLNDDRELDMLHPWSPTPESLCCLNSLRNSPSSIGTRLLSEPRSTIFSYSYAAGQTDPRLADWRLFKSSSSKTRSPRTFSMETTRLATRNSASTTTVSSRSQMTSIRQSRTTRSRSQQLSNWRNLSTGKG